MFNLNFSVSTILIAIDSRQSQLASEGLVELAIRLTKSIHDNGEMNYSAPPTLNGPGCVVLLFFQSVESGSNSSDLHSQRDGYRRRYHYAVCNEPPIPVHAISHALRTFLSDCLSFTQHNSLNNLLVPNSIRLALHPTPNAILRRPRPRPHHGAHSRVPRSARRQMQVRAPDRRRPQRRTPPAPHRGLG